MKLGKLFLSIGMISAALFLTQCTKDEIISDGVNFSSTELDAKGGKNVTSEETAGNNLSFPVIWSDGETKVLRGTMGTVTLAGTWWGVWGEDPIDPQAPLYSCGPYIGDVVPCIESEYKAYIQKDLNNEWQATNWIPTAPIKVDGVDWGDNLESIDWSLKSQVRTEIVLYENTTSYNGDGEVVEYAMRHADSWGEDEVHGLQTTLTNEIVYGPADIATVFTPNARLTIQKLNVRNLEDLYIHNEFGERIGQNLTWNKGKGWTENDNIEDDLVNDNPLYNLAVYEASDGPGYFNAEVNVKGKIIYGYTWNMRKMNDGDGYYRVTFSFDDVTNLNTFFDNNTEILLPIEEEETITSSEDDDGGNSGEGTRGGVGVIDFQNNLTYMDILIVPKTTGSGGGSGSGSGGGHGNH